MTTYNKYVTNKNMYMQIGGACEKKEMCYIDYPLQPYHDADKNRCCANESCEEKDCKQLQHTIGYELLPPLTKIKDTYKEDTYTAGTLQEPYRYRGRTYVTYRKFTRNSDKIIFKKVDTHIIGAGASGVVFLFESDDKKHKIAVKCGYSKGESEYPKKERGSSIDDEIKIWKSRKNI